ncbi:unnamed protein product [Moneuplotes crassus]|uniref:EF-hand domain-containing protein n=1 Tax=Euplotes crassus TaxID=5936 RepID=A0AAD1XXF7_EUPCR|nr:unnamed protein product [Moneuplotes crassus]
MPRSRKPNDSSANRRDEEEKHRGDSSGGKKDEWTQMRTILSRIHSDIEKDQGNVTYSAFMAAVYAYYVTNEEEFYTFIKYIEEYINNNRIKIDGTMSREELIHLCMPCHSRAKLLDSPDPVEVMLFFELIDIEMTGTIELDELSKRLAEVNCFVDSGCDYKTYTKNLKSYGTVNKEFRESITNIIDQLSLKEDNFLTPEEFYNFVAAAMEINGAIQK